MAFVLNILHRDFSLLCTDTHGRPDGPRRIWLRRSDASLANAPSAERIDTLCLNEDTSVALGLSGSRNEHGYVAGIENSCSIDDALTLVREYMDEFRTDRGTLLRSGPQVEHSGVLTFFDSHRAAYYSSTYHFSEAHSSARMAAQHPIAARLLTAGPGSALFQRLLQTKDHADFAASVRTIDDLNRCLNWVPLIYEAMHRTDPSIGGRPIGVLSTRTHPLFSSAALGGFGSEDDGDRTRGSSPP